MPFAQFLNNINALRYRLDMAGIVALFGGDYAVSALLTIHIHEWRNQIGWYNYPGGITVACRFGQIAKSPLWDTLFPGPNEGPAKAFGFDGKQGLGYTEVLSGTKLPSTGHLVHLLSRAVDKRVCNVSKQWIEKEVAREGEKVRQSMLATVGVVKLSEPRGKNSDQLVPKRHRRYALYSIIPSLVSLIASCWCWFANDTLCAMLILTGMLSSGISFLCLGSAKLSLDLPTPSKGAPVGHGFLCPNEKDIIILMGSEQAVATITRGRFKLTFPAILNDKNHHLIGVSSLLLVTHSLVQLLLMPLITFFGQLLFISSIVASGFYHLYLSSLDNEAVQQELLSGKLPMTIGKVELGTRTQLAVFVCLALADELKNTKLDYEKILKMLIPNEPEVWEEWRKTVVSQLQKWIDGQQQRPFSHLELDSEDIRGYSAGDKRLRKDLIDDARLVFTIYPQLRAKMFEDPSVDAELADWPSSLRF